MLAHAGCRIPHVLQASRLRAADLPVTVAEIAGAMSSASSGLFHRAESLTVFGFEAYP